MTASSSLTHRNDPDEWRARASGSDRTTNDKTHGTVLAFNERDGIGRLQKCPVRPLPVESQDFTMLSMSRMFDAG